MLYLVSGSSRSGKSTIARRILKQTGIPYLSLDWVMMGFTNGMPEFGIHDKLWPDEIAARLDKFLLAMCENILWAEEGLVIEGEAILPGSARILLDKHLGRVRACFLGYTTVDIETKMAEAKAYPAGENDWLLEESDETIRQHLQNMVAYSKKVERQCKKHRIRYFDTSADFPAAMDRATQYLLSET